MWYLTAPNIKIVREILEANEIQYDLADDGDIYTGYELETITLLDDFGIVSHAMTASELNL